MVLVQNSTRFWRRVNTNTLQIILQNRKDLNIKLDTLIVLEEKVNPLTKEETFWTEHG